MSRSMLALALCLPLLVQAQPASARSYKEVRDRVFAKPLSTLPKEEGVTPGQVLQALVLKSGAFVDRIKGTLSDSDDFKPAAPKLLHPMGICAEAEWIIDGESPATGLLAKGARARAIVRFSAADTQTEFSPSKPRIFGLAIKLFPARAAEESTETRNLFNLDQGGLGGTVRERYLGNAPSSLTYFENQAKGSGFLVERLEALFRLFDMNPNKRPLYPVTEVNADGSIVGHAATPDLLRFVPRVQTSLHYARDFREELRAYNAGEIQFDIVLPKQGGEVAIAQNQTIGRLVVGKPVVSTACDHELHFRHHPTR